MVFRVIRALLNDERIIRQLSESAPIRIIARTIVRGEKVLAEKVKRTNISSQIEMLTKLFKEEYRKSLKK
ncbi:hypothetical protein DICVIV_03741 [Dictyocaulus viviparus]|uniref:Uncharacterized protein n=1 Tax=Dictyocaulus viviparus TaxID=29172 RepID=A0A0D8Y228_DICVI|nr:hypothetical protein DICVIV_03741 [Dictyocaulus viviparus]